jgi:monodehydroascorbate reductase (NADH)
MFSLIVGVTNVTSVSTLIMYASWVAVARLFTPEIAAFYETYYEKKGVNFIKGNVMASFEQDEFGKVCVIDLG